MGYLLVRCDGSKSIQELYSQCCEAGWIDPNTPPREFIELIGLLVSGGFLCVEEIKQPAAIEMTSSNLRRGNVLREHRRPGFGLFLLPPRLSRTGSG